MDGKGKGRKSGKRKRSASTPKVTELLATITKHIGNAYAEGSKKVIKSALAAFRDFEEAYPERQALLEPTYAGDPVAALRSADEQMRCIRISALTYEDIETNVAIGTDAAKLYERIEKADAGGVDAFLSHSWRDDAKAQVGEAA